MIVKTIVCAVFCTVPLNAYAVEVFLGKKLGFVLYEHKAEIVADGYEALSTFEKGCVKVSISSSTKYLWVKTKKPHHSIDRVTIDGKRPQIDVYFPAHA